MSASLSARKFFPLILLAALSLCMPALAQDRSERAAAAEALFDQGRHLIENEQYVEACPKFEESYRLDPGLGTLLYLSDCYENIGKTASAWAGFRQAAAEARASGQPEREQIARQRAGALHDRLSKLTIAVPDASELPALGVQRDGIDVGSALWNIAIPVDPGRHEVVARADGKIPWSTVIDVKPGVRVTTVTIPVLQDAPEAKPEPQPRVHVSSPSPQPDEVTSGDGQRLWAAVAGGVGVAGLAVGSFYGLRASSRWEDAKEHCTPELVCDDAGVDLHDEAEQSGNIASIAFGIGGAALVTGVALWLTAPTESQEDISGDGLLIGPTAGLDIIGVQAKGRF